MNAVEAQMYHTASSSMLSCTCLISFLPVESFLHHSDAIRDTGKSDKELQDAS